MNLTADFDAKLQHTDRAIISSAANFAKQHLQQKPTAIDSRAMLVNACASGLAGIEVGKDFGGANASFSARMRVCEELAQWDAAFTFSLINHHNVIERIARSAPPSVANVLVPSMLSGNQFGCTAMSEPQSGSDFKSMQTTATESSDGWILNGDKAWITNAAFCDVFLVYAQTNPAAGAAGVACFIVLAEDSGFIRTSPYDLPTLENMGVGRFTLKQCHIPSERVLYPPGQGFKAAMRGVNQARTHVAAMNSGMIDCALRLATEFGNKREAFGHKLLEFQGLTWSLANVATTLYAMRLMTYRSAQLIDVGHDARYEAAMAKKFSNEHALNSIGACMQAMGAAGLIADIPLGRHLNCARAFCYTDGTPEMMNERISQLLKKSK